MNEFLPPAEEKVQAIFSKVAHRYDLTNDVLSLGIHRIWKKKLVRETPLAPSAKILDCASGTGDLAVAWKSHLGPLSQVIATDFNKSMLSMGATRFQRAGIHFEIADVLQLPFESNSFDAVSISFGIRNVSDPIRGLAEMHRVLKPGGVLKVLEFGQPPGWFKHPYQFYSRHLLPRIGGWLTSARDAYGYLEKSSALFPSGKGFQELLNSAAPWQQVQVQSLSFGIAFIYTGLKSKSQTKLN